VAQSKGFGAPRLGNNCLLGAGAVVVGGVRVGDNVRIGANCTVAHDVPDETVAVAAPARMISKPGLVNKHFFQSPSGQWLEAVSEGSPRPCVVDGPCLPGECHCMFECAS